MTKSTLPMTVTFKVFLATFVYPRSFALISTFTPVVSHQHHPHIPHIHHGNNSNLTSLSHRQGHDSRSRNPYSDCTRLVLTSTLWLEFSYFSCYKRAKADQDTHFFGEQNEEKGRERRADKEVDQDLRVQEQLWL